MTLVVQGDTVYHGWVGKMQGNSMALEVYVWEFFVHDLAEQEAEGESWSLLVFPFPLVWNQGVIPITIMVGLLF